MQPLYDADQRLEQDPHPGPEKALLLSHHQGQFCEANSVWRLF